MNYQLFERRSCERNKVTNAYWKITENETIEESAQIDSGISSADSFNKCYNHG